MDSVDRHPWHALTDQQTAERLGTDREAGLDAAEAEARLAQHGANVLEESRRTSAWRVLARQFWDPLVGLLVAAAAVSLAIGHRADAATILGIVVLNAVLGFTQEWRAERALEALRRMLAPTCTVVREGRPQEVQAAVLVPGDVVRLSAGSLVPADVRLTSGTDVGIDESALTGESAAVDKCPAPVAESATLHEREDMAWMGTTVVRGRGRGLVVATGMQTAFGTVARLAQDVDTSTTPLQRQLARLGARIGLYGVTVSAAVAVAGWVVGRDIVEMFFTGVALAVAVVPEGLPAVVTITLALGVRTMVRKKVLLRRLAGAETLGGATVVCTDKTGTLTRGEMTVRQVWVPGHCIHTTGVGYDPAGHFEEGGAELSPAERPGLVAVLETAQRCNHADVRQTPDGWMLVGEPTEGALITAAMKASLERPSLDVDLEVPFDSTRKRMAIVERRGSRRRVHVKGAPEVVLELATHVMDGEARLLGDAERSQIEARYREMAREGLRVLALACRDLPGDVGRDPGVIESDLTLLGLVGLMDPARPEVPRAIERARSAGIRVVVITGDAPDTALAVARQIGLPAERALVGADLEALSDEALTDALRESVVFARTTPAHKLRIVSLLQRLGDVVGMTGDGVNDAPALKKADVGIAMGIRGTDAAKGASDLVLVDDNFATIVNAVEEGRRQYDNIKKFVHYLLSSNMGEVVAIFVSILIGGPLILLPVQILWTNLITDGLTAVALGLEPAERGVMRRPPRNPSASLLDRSGLLMIALLGGYVGVATLVLFYVYADPSDVDRARTIAFCGLILVEKANVLNFRTLDAPMRRVSFFSNPWLIRAVLLMIGIQVIAVYAPPLQRLLHTVPLRAVDWLVMLGIALPVFPLGEFIKRRVGRAAPIAA